MYKKGFISSYFLYVFLLISIIITTYTMSLSYKLKSLYNIKISNEYLSQEIVVLNFIKCNINSLKSSNYDFNDINFDINLKDSLIEIIINSEYKEKIICYLDGNKILYYETFSLEDKSI